MSAIPLLFVHGNIHTMRDGAQPADALAIDRVSGRVLAVGAERDVRADVGIYTRLEVIDLQGRTVIPGMIDAHTHLLSAARDTVEVDLSGCRDAAEAVGRVAARASGMPAGSWVRGRHWNQQFWPDARFPTRQDLDRAIPDHPVALWAHSQHVMWVNSLALARAGIDAMTPDPPGARIGRDAQGEPDGILYEFGATDRIDDVYEVESPPDVRELLSLRRVVAELNARGLTAVQTMEGAHSLRQMRRLREQDALPLRVGYFLRTNQFEAARAVGIEAGFGDDWLRIAGIKLFADGALGTHTAAMLTPFNDDPGNLGLLTTSPDHMRHQVGGIAQAGLHVAIHAIGDRAVRVALDGIATALAQAPAGGALRFRIEHVQLIDPADLQRMARLGVVASIQPFHAVADRDVADRSWGQRTSLSYAYHTLAAAGIPLALGSDVPIETADPLRILHAAIVRRDDRTPDRDPWHPDEALSAYRALWSYTVGSAYAAGDEARLGRLAPGYLGDCVVLADDPLRVAPGDLPMLPISAVVVGGTVRSGSL